MKKRWETAEDRPAVLISEEDREYLSQFKWKISQNGYVYRTGHWKMDKNRETMMHRLVARARKGEIVHHINGNKLDNRRSNLELLTSVAEHAQRHYEQKRQRSLRRGALRVEEWMKDNLTFLTK